MQPGLSLAADGPCAGPPAPGPPEGEATGEAQVTSCSTPHLQSSVSDKYDASTGTDIATMSTFPSHSMRFEMSSPVLCPN